MSNLLWLTNILIVVVLISCQPKPADSSAISVDTIGTTSMADTMKLDTVAKRSQVDTLQARESNPASSMVAVERDTLKHVHEHGSPTQAKDDSMKMAKTKGKFK